MTSRLLSLALFLVVALTGCRDALVDPPLSPLPDPDVPPATTLLSPYFKGSDVISIGEVSHFRVEYVEGAADYRWSISWTDEVNFEGTFDSDSQGLSRFLDARASGPGRILFAVSVFDGENNKIAEVSKRVTAVAR